MIDKSKKKEAFKKYLEGLTPEERKKKEAEDHEASEKEFREFFVAFFTYHFTALNLSDYFYI